MTVHVGLYEKVFGFSLIVSLVINKFCFRAPRSSGCRMFAFVTTLLLFVNQFSSAQAKYEANWKSLDSRPLPSWYDEAKFGIFMHWGVYSVPSFNSEWFWWYWKGKNDPKCVEFMKKNYRQGFSYADFAPMFRAEFFDPDLWADLLERSGARFVCQSYIIFLWLRVVRLSYLIYFWCHLSFMNQSNRSLYIPPPRATPGI